MMRNFFTVLLTLFLFFSSTTLQASVYDDDVLNIYSKILPRLILMSTKKNMLKEKIDICILHDKIDERIAVSLAEKISSEYPEGIKNLKINMTNTLYTDIDACQNSQIAFLFNSSETTIEKATEFSDKHRMMTMSYNSKYLDNGVGLSLFLGRKVIPYINMSAFRKTGIELDNVLVRISKIYSEDGK